MDGKVDHIYVVEGKVNHMDERKCGLEGREEGRKEGGLERSKERLLERYRKIHGKDV